MVFDQSLSYQGAIQPCFRGLHILDYRETQSSLNHDRNVKFSICLLALLSFQLFGICFGFPCSLAILGGDLRLDVGDKGCNLHSSWQLPCQV